MAVISRTSFSTGDLLTAAQWNTQFDTAYNVINGNLDSTNIASQGVASTNIASNAVRGSHILTATVTAGHTSGLLSKGFRKGLRVEYATAGSVKINAGYIDIGGVIYYLAASANVLVSATAATADRYFYINAPSSGYGITASTDIVVSNSAPTYSDSNVAYYSGSSRALAMTRLNSTGQVVSNNVQNYDTCYASGVVVVAAGGGDVTINLPFDWSGGYSELHRSTSATTYWTATPYNTTHLSSHEAVTNASYTDEQIMTLSNNSSITTVIKSLNDGVIKSATATSFTIDEDGATVYVKWFIWTEGLR